MPDVRHPSRPTRPTRPVNPRRRRPRSRSRLGLTFAAVVGLVLGLGQAVSSPAVAGPLPTPTGMVVSAYSPESVIGPISGAPGAAIPAVLAAKGDTFLVSVRLTAGADGSLDAAYPKDQAVTLVASGPGALTSPTPTVIPRNTTLSVFAVSYSKEATGVTIQASTGKPSSLVTGTSNAFDVNRFLSFLPGTAPALLNGTAGADGAGCAVVDRDNPLCGRVLLPEGASGSVALSLGLCPAGAGCKPGSLVTQLIGDLTDGAGVNIYDRENPARMELICDKSLCGKAGVSAFTALWSNEAFGGLDPVPACAAKDVIDPDPVEYCTDYRSSQRDGAGDLHLVVLFLTDVRGGI